MKVRIEEGQILLAISEKEFRTLNWMVSAWIGYRIEDGTPYRHIKSEFLQMHSDFSEQERKLKRLLTSLKRRRQTLLQPKIESTPLFDLPEK